MLTYADLIRNNPILFNNEKALIEIITDKQMIRNWEAQRKKELTEQALPTDWADIGVVYEDPYILIVRDLVKFQSGMLGTYFRLLNSADLKGGQGTTIMPLYESKILLMRQFRHPTRDWHWEIPRGFGEPDTSPSENARNEIFEEIQGELLDLIDLGPYHSNTGISGTNTQLYLARLKSIGLVNQDEGIQSYKLVDINIFEKMICDAEITDGFTIAAFTRALLRGYLILNN